MDKAVVLGWAGAFRIFPHPRYFFCLLFSRPCSLQVKAMEVDVEERPKELVQLLCA